MSGPGPHRTASRVLDLAGVAIEVDASDPGRATLAAVVLAGARPVVRAPEVVLALDDRRVGVPPGPPRDALGEVRLWVDGDRVTVAAGDAVGTAAGRAIALHVPSLDVAPAVEAMAPVLLTWVLAPHRRYLVHGAAVAQGDTALLVLGASGAGKSTLVAAALEHGWDALSDDIVVLEAEGGAVRVHGLHRVPAVPVEIGGPVVSSGVPVDDPRGRTELPRSVLTPGGVPLVGTVLATHAASDDGELHAVGGAAVVPLLCQSFAGMVDAARRAAFFAFTAHVSALPAWRLGHSGDVDARRAHVGAALAELLAATRNRSDVSDPAR